MHSYLKKTGQPAGLDSCRVSRGGGCEKLCHGSLFKLKNRHELCYKLMSCMPVDNNP